MRVAHLSHHSGCIADFEYVAGELGLEVSSHRFDDGYNIGPQRAREAWERWREPLSDADVVLVSDTTPIARMLLENLGEQHVVLWVCNRFDYADQAANDCGFPDEAYYELMRRSVRDERVHVAAYTPFELEYARGRGVELGERVIKPVGRRVGRVPAPPSGDVYVMPYDNDRRFLDLEGARTGPYAGPQDLDGVRAVVHVPYAWSTFAFFERLQGATPMLVPSRRLLFELPGLHWQDPQRLGELIELSEWYAPEHEELLVRFDSLEELPALLRDTDLEPVRERMRAFAERHTVRTLAAWSELFDEIEHDAVRMLRPFRSELERHNETELPSRFESFSVAFEHLREHGGRTVVELGTTRSFVHGGLPGCNEDDPALWRPREPDRWDWGAGCFTLLAARCLDGVVLHTVDTAHSHIARSRVITAPYAANVRYHVCDSVQFLRSWAPGTLDLVYLDTGDMWPIEPTAELQLAEAQTICEERLLSEHGMLLIDDVGNPTPRRFGDTSPHGKSKYALPYLLEQGFEVVFDGYQVALRRA